MFPVIQWTGENITAVLAKQISHQIFMTPAFKWLCWNLAVSGLCPKRQRYKTIMSSLWNLCRPPCLSFTISTGDEDNRASSRAAGVWSGAEFLGAANCSQEWTYLKTDWAKEAVKMYVNACLHIHIRAFICTLSTHASIRPRAART